MDPGRFDALTRALATPRSRRGFLAAAGAAAAAVYSGRRGAAQITCPPGQSPNRKGDCSCPAGTDACPTGCFNLRRDPDHCGRCDRTCIGGECIKGECRCPAGTALCNGVCRSPASFLSDPANCGGCGAACPTGYACAGGTCCIGHAGDCSAAACCDGFYCDSTDRCFACAGEGDDICEIEGDACCTAETGLQCLDPGTGTRVCHDPAVCIGPGGDCDGVSFVCGAGHYCDSTGTCSLCAAEGENTCEIEAGACCTDQTGLVCVDPGTGTRVCQVPAG